MTSFDLAAIGAVLLVGVPHGGLDGAVARRPERADRHADRECEVGVLRRCRVLPLRHIRALRERLENLVF